MTKTPDRRLAANLHKVRVRIGAPDMRCTRTWPASCAWLAIALLALATSAAAQSTPTDVPGQPAAPEIRHVRATPNETLLLTLGLSGDTFDELFGGGSFEAPHPIADFESGLAYHNKGRRATFDVTGRSVTRRTNGTLTPIWQQGTFGLALAGEHQELRAFQGVTYSPSYQFGPASGIMASPELDTAQAHNDFVNSDVTALAVTSNLDWTWTLSRRTLLSATYDLHDTTFSRSDLDMTTQAAGANLTRRLSRSLALRTGYTYRIARSGLTVGDPVRVNDINAGVEFSRPLSKRSSLSFGTGSSLVPQDGQLSYRITGDALVTRQIGRTWNTRFGFIRGVRLVEGFADPVVDNALNTVLAGNVARRVTLSVSGSLSSGTVGLNTAPGNGYWNWTTASGLSVSLVGHLMIDAQYFCISDHYEDGVTLPPGVVSQRRRQGVRIGLTLRAPLIQN
jgi:hypothetical protein